MTRNEEIYELLVELTRNNHLCWTRVIGGYVTGLGEFSVRVEGTYELGHRRSLGAVVEVTISGLPGLHFSQNNNKLLELVEQGNSARIEEVFLARLIRRREECKVIHAT
jgi:hypothetical protein